MIVPIPKTNWYNRYIEIFWSEEEYLIPTTKKRVAVSGINHMLGFRPVNFRVERHGFRMSQHVFPVKVDAWVERIEVELHNTIVSRLPAVEGKRTGTT